MKVLTANLMISRLLIIFAQLKAGNSSQKLKTKSENYYIYYIA